jgi:8-oxo-dGTP pyrophosphatase MutT (NUDIX family)
MGEKPQKLQSGRGGGASSRRTSEKTTIIRPGAVTREFSSGGVVFKGECWLLRATSPSVLFPKVHWTLPKGQIDKGESLEGAAIREVEEETGVGAKVVKKIGTIKYFYNHPKNGNILKFVTFYLMEFVKDLPDGHDEETSEVAWLPFEEAYKKLSFGGEKQILKKASEALLNTSQPSLLG